MLCGDNETRLALGAMGGACRGVLDGQLAMHIPATSVAPGFATAGSGAYGSDSCTSTGMPTTQQLNWTGKLQLLGSNGSPDIRRNLEAIPDRLLLSEYRLDRDGEEHENTCNERNPYWHEVRPPFIPLYLSIMKINCGSDELACEV